MYRLTNNNEVINVLVRWFLSTCKVMCPIGTLGDKPNDVRWFLVTEHRRCDVNPRDVDVCVIAGRCQSAVRGRATHTNTVFSLYNTLLFMAYHGLLLTSICIPLLWQIQRYCIAYLEHPHLPQPHPSMFGTAILIKDFAACIDHDKKFNKTCAYPERSHEWVGVYQCEPYLHHYRSTSLPQR